MADCYEAFSIKFYKNLQTMKKIFILLSFIGLSLLFFTCKKQEAEPEIINSIYDSRNKLSVEINGKTESEGYFDNFGATVAYSEGGALLYDTIPYPRYYNCPYKRVADIGVSFSKNITQGLVEDLYLETRDPHINLKLKVKGEYVPQPKVSPKNACDYDSLFSTNHYTTLELDQFGSSFKVNMKELNNLTITSYDTLSGKMTGEFNLTFDKVSKNSKSKYYESLPPKLEYRNGKFTVYVKEFK
jgi:hypothetical protein